VGKIKASA